MLKKSNSRTSLFSNQKQPLALKLDPEEVCQQIRTTLGQASKVLSHEMFSPMSFRLLKSLIRRAETESPHSQTIFLTTINECLHLYNTSLELIIRTQLLEVLCEINSNLLEDIGVKLQKIKHTVIHTQIQFLIVKAFLLEEKYLVLQGDESAAIKSLKKCIQLNQSHLIEYLQASEDIRQEIVDNTIFAHYQLYRLLKTKKPTHALDSLSKALSALKKSYGNTSSLSICLESLQSQQENYLNNLEKMSSKSRAITEIIEIQTKKNLRTSAFYSWQDQKLVAQLLRVKEGQRQVLSQTFYEIKLDISKIKQLKNGEWLSIGSGRIQIIQDELLRLLGVTNSNNNNTKEMTTHIEVRNLSRDQIIKKDYLSSSSDSQNFFERDQFNFLKLNHGGRAQSSKKFKQTH